tara:strand:+ start:101 stop:412 length:312 start_codon:yes stop_codon:yes gene_type:complete
MSVYLIILLVTLFLIIGLAAWCIFFLLKRLLYLSDNLQGVVVELEEYEKHIEKIYSMEMFYGEPVIQNLLEHTHEVNVNIKEFIEEYSERQTIEEKENQKTAS